MKVLRLKLKNFLSYKELNISLNNLGLVLVSGETGSGKSSIFKAICYAITDKADVKLKELVNWYNSDSPAYVKLLVKIDKHKYWIIKKISNSGNKTTIKSKTDKFLINNSKNWTSTDHKNFIKELIDIDYESFISSTYIKQGEVNSLVNGTYSERNKILSKFQDIPIIENARKLQLEDYKKINYDIRKIEGKIEYLESKFDYTNISDVREKYNDSTNKLKFCRNELRDIDLELNTIRQKIFSIEKSSEDYIFLKKEIKSQEEKIENIEKNIEFYTRKLQKLKEYKKEYKKELIKLNNECSKLDDQKNIINQSIKTLKYKKNEKLKIEDSLNNIKSELNKLTSEKNYYLKQIDKNKQKISDIKNLESCNYCLQDVDKYHKANIKSELSIDNDKNDKKCKEIQEAINKIELSKKFVNEKLEKINREIEEVKSETSEEKLFLKEQIILNKIESKTSEIQNTEETIEEIENNLASMSNLMYNISTSLEKNRAKFSSLSFDETDLDIFKSRYRKQLEEKDRLSEKLIYLISQEQKYQSIIKAIKRNEKELEGLRKTKIKIEKDLVYHEILKEIFSKEGFRVYKFHNMIELINNYIMFYQSHFSDSKICSAEFYIDDKNRIELRVWMEGVEEPISLNSLSGGELEMVTLPIILAIFSYISKRNYFNVLFIDESLVFLDKDKKILIHNILQEIKDKGINVFIVSHDSIIKEFEYDTYFNVKNKDGYSTIEVVNNE